MDYLSLVKLSFKDYSNYLKTYQSRIHNECSTVLDFKISDNVAFYLTNQEILLLITKIMSVDRVLNQKVESLPDVALKQYTIQLLIDEIKQTNDIESVYSTKKEIRETYKKISKGVDKGRFNGLISKYLKFQTNEEIKLENCEDIRNLYNELVLKEVIEEDKDNAPDGLIFRKDPVNVHTSTGKVIHEGLYPEDRIINSMTSALSVLNDDSVNYLVSAAVFHYLFAYIHPFYDGNGRTDRFISSYVISKNLNHLVAYKFSYIIKKHQKRYYDMFADTNAPRNMGDITPFIIQFLEFVLEAEKELVEDIDERLTNYKYYLSKIEHLNLRETEYNIAYLLLLVALFDDEGMAINSICKVVEKSYNTVKEALNHFEEMGIIRIETLGNKKIYDLDLNKLSKVN